jgi:RNA polymerase sigma-70 factor, ECF subfamily
MTPTPDVPGDEREHRLASREETSKLLDEEHVLIHAAQKGDRDAFAVLVERYWDRLYRWLYHLTHDRHAAEDVVQETFLKAFAGLRLFRAGSNFRAWLFRIGHNCFVNQRRGGKHKNQPYPDNLADEEEGPVERVLSREALQLLARAVGRLPSEFRAAFLLRAEEGMSFRQIGDVLDLTEETARWRVFKARQKLLTVLAPQLGVVRKPGQEL